MAVSLLRSADEEADTQIKRCVAKGYSQASGEAQGLMKGSDMLYCRGCGKEIHESAASCPHCGFQYTQISENSGIWMLIISTTLSGILLLNWVNIPWDGDEDLITGVIFFGIISLLFSGISFSKYPKWKPIHIPCIFISSISILIAIGSN